MRHHKTWRAVQGHQQHTIYSIQMTEQERYRRKGHNYSIKPLQGVAFRQMRSLILNMPSNNLVSEVHRSVLGKVKKTGMAMQ